jgi:hypothetical protein
MTINGIHHAEGEPLVIVLGLSREHYLIGLTLDQVGKKIYLKRHGKIISEFNSRDSLQSILNAADMILENESAGIQTEVI